MNVDTAAIGPSITRVETTQVQDAGDDGITSAGVWPQDLAGGPAALEDGASTSTVADLLRNLESAQRRGEALRLIAEAELRGGDRELSNAKAVLDDGEALFWDAYDDGAITCDREWPCDEASECSREEEGANRGHGA